MRSGILRYSANRPIQIQGYWKRPFTFLADLFTGVEERREADYFSQHAIQEIIDLKKFPMGMIFPQVEVNQRTKNLKTIEGVIEISKTVLDQFDNDKIGEYLRTKIGTGIYGAPAFNMRFLVYKSGRSKMTITRRERAYPLG